MTSERVLIQLFTADRIRRLPTLCHMLLRGYYNADNDPEPLFAGLPYAEVASLALREPSVRSAVALLPSNWRGWAS